MASETTPLVSNRGRCSDSLPSNIFGASLATAYFLGAHQRNAPSGVDSLATPTGQAEVDAPPAGATATEFDSRPVLGRDPPPPAWKGKFAQGEKGGASMDAGEGVGTLVLPRKVPLKVEPKVHFANERTFLAWLHLILVPAAASLAIVAYSTGDDLVGQFYGIVLLPVSVAYMFYALWQYLRRSAMIKHHQPGPYIDVSGPVTLTVILMASIMAQFCLKLHQVIDHQMRAK